MCDVCKLTAPKAKTRTDLSIQVGDIVRSPDIDIAFDATIYQLTALRQNINVGVAPRRYVVVGIHSEQRKVFASLRVFLPSGQIEGPEIPILIEYEQKQVFPLDRVVVVQRSCTVTAW